MANHKHTQKDVRQSSKRRERNRYYGKTTRNAIRNVKTLVETDADKAKENLPSVISMIDKLVKRNVIHRNKAANMKSAVMKKILQSKEVNAGQAATAKPKKVMTKKAAKKTDKKTDKKK